MHSPLDAPAHWETVYRQRGHAAAGPAGVSWYSPHLACSLDGITRWTAGDLRARILDVGTGESTLADDLLARGYPALTLLDLSATALVHLRTRLHTRFGPAACSQLQWQTGDVTRLALPAAGFDLWHDRAVLHFLTDPLQRANYVAQALRCVRPGGVLVVATFAPDGPSQCSQLPVMRYSADELARLFEPGFEPLASERDLHVTPGGAQQAFQYLFARRR
jgi:SAM-dependent methyltransferase